MANPPPVHVPVMATEVLQWLDPQPGNIVIDGTLGGGGHTRMLAEKVGASGLVLSFDRDPAAIARAEQNLAGLPLKVVNASYSTLLEVLQSQQISQVDGVLLDLGLSSDQLADIDRGFSFDSQGPLDLRFDPTEGEPAWQMIERASERQLADWIYHYGEERFSRRIARRIVEHRKKDPLRSAKQIADLVRRCVPRSRHHRIDPATRTFQALRIVVNNELQLLEEALKMFPRAVRRGGRVAVISFHSLEDRLVKTGFRDNHSYRPLTKKPITPTESEIRRNPRSSSAKLRVAEIASPAHQPTV